MSEQSKNEGERWHYAKGGKRHGPVSFDDLQQMYQAHVLNETTLVWEPSLGQEWCEISTVKGMLPDDQVPHLPTNRVSDLWLYSMVFIPLIVLIVKITVIELNPAVYEYQSLFDFLAIALVVGFGIKDSNVVFNSGRKYPTMWPLAWILLFYPVYVGVRAARTQRGLWPLLACFVSLCLITLLIIEFSWLF